MAQRAVGLEPKPYADNARASDVTMRAVPLDLAPLLAPYRKQGRLSLRIERLHHLARLSAGRNNGDHSWSLTLDELEDLNYLLPENVGGHTISLRIIGLNHGGSTLAVLDHPVALQGMPKSAPAQAAADPSIERELRSLREELKTAKEALAGAKADLAARDAELQAAPQKPSALAPAASQNGDPDIAAARAAWKAELDERLTTAASEAASDLERSRKVWQAEWSARLSSANKEADARVEQRISEAREDWRKESVAALAQARAEADAAKGQASESERRLSEKIAALEVKLEQKEAALARSQIAAGQAKGKAEADISALLLQAENNWKTAEAARLAAAETQWKESAAKTLSEVRAEVDAAKGRESDRERRLSEKITALEKKLEEKETALARSEIGAETAREQWQRETEAAFAKVKGAWQNEEAARFAAAEGQWKENSAKALNEARAAADAVKGQGAESERRLNEKIAVLEGNLGEKETALVRSEIGAETAREQWQRETEAAFAKAKSAWQSEEAARLTAAEVQWKESSLKALNEARAAADAVKGQGAESERRLNEKIAFLETRLTERDTALARAGIAAEQAYEQWQRESEVALSKAKGMWKTEEALRLAAAEAQWKELSAAALSQARAETETARNTRSENERRLQEKIAALEERLDKREQDVARASIAAEEERARLQREADAALTSAEATWNADSEARIAEADAKRREQSQAALHKAQGETDAARREAESAKQRVSRMAQDAEAALAQAKTVWSNEEVAKRTATETRFREQMAAASAQAHAESDAAQRRWQQEAKDALAKAESAWKADETSRMAQAEAQWRKRSAGALAEATARFEAAETALAQMRKKNEAARQRADLDAVDRMHEEYRALQAARAADESNAAIIAAPLSEQMGPPHGKIVLKHSPFLSTDDANGKDEKKRSRPVLDVTVAAAIAASIVFYFYPRVEAYVPATINSKIAMMTEGMSTIGQRASEPANDAPVAAKPQKIVVTNPVNMRAAPSASADVVSTALGGMEVEKLEQRGNWTRIRVNGKGGKQEGWVNSSFLKTAGDKTASAKRD